MWQLARVAEGSSPAGVAALCRALLAHDSLSLDVQVSLESSDTKVYEP